MPPKLNCANCKKRILHRQYLTCSRCKQSFDLACTNAEKLFHLMTQDRKISWSCIKCRMYKMQERTNITPTVQKSKVSVASTSTPKNTADCVLKKSTYSSAEKIVAAPIDSPPVQQQSRTLSNDATVLNYNIPLQNSFDTLSHEESLDGSVFHDNTLNRSCPDLSGIQLNKANIRKDHSVTGDLSRHSLPNINNQIQNIVIEELKEEVRVLREQLLGADNEIQKLLGETYTLRNELSDTRKKCDLYKKLLKGEAPLTPSRTPVNKTKIVKQVIPTAKFTDSDSSSGPASKTCDSEFIDFKVVETKNRSLFNERAAINDLKSGKYNNVSAKNKLLFLSSNNKNKITKIVTDGDYFPNFSFCHYIKPGVGVKHLLEDINSHLTHMTRHDYCVVLIGEDDFKRSNDLVALVQYIRESVKNITFTNLILACPTFICGRPLYNARVDIFNHLLFKDLNNYNKCFYAYDCNSNLKPEMFSMWSGKLSNSGMNNIIENLDYNICCYLNDNSAEFFRV